MFGAEIGSLRGCCLGEDGEGGEEGEDVGEVYYGLRWWFSGGVFLGGGGKGVDACY